MNDQSIAPIPDQAADPMLYRVLISGLVAAVLITICGIIALAAMQRPVPEGLVALGSACAGGLVGLLVPSPVA
jgi:TRAP-type mannitol/chloroaromatic compound transport system permease large subunit